MRKQTTAHVLFLRSVSVRLKLTAVSMWGSAGGEEGGKGERCQGRNDRMKQMEGAEIGKGGTERGKLKERKNCKTEREKGAQRCRIKH